MTKQYYDEMVQKIKQYKQLNDYTIELEYAIKEITDHDNLHGIQVNMHLPVNTFKYAPEKYRDQFKQHTLESLQNILACVKQEMAEI